MRKTRLVILPTKCLHQMGFLLLFLSCPVIGDWGRIRPESENSHRAIQIEREGTCGLQRDPPGGLFQIFNTNGSNQCRISESETTSTNNKIPSSLTRQSDTRRIEINIRNFQERRDTRSNQRSRSVESRRLLASRSPSLESRTNENRVFKRSAGKGIEPERRNAQRRLSLARRSLERGYERTVENRRETRAETERRNNERSAVGRQLLQKRTMEKSENRRETRFFIEQKKFERNIENSLNQRQSRNRENNLEKRSEIESFVRRIPDSSIPATAENRKTSSISMARRETEKSRAKRWDSERANLVRRDNEISSRISAESRESERRSRMSAARRENERHSRISAERQENERQSRMSAERRENERKSPISVERRETERTFQNFKERPENDRTSEMHLERQIREARVQKKLSERRLFFSRLNQIQIQQDMNRRENARTLNLEGKQQEMRKTRVVERLPDKSVRTDNRREIELRRLASLSPKQFTNERKQIERIDNFKTFRLNVVPEKTKENEEFFESVFKWMGLDNYQRNQISYWSTNCVIGAVAYFLTSRQVKVV